MQHGSTGGTGDGTKERIGQALRAAREQRGLRQVDVADALGTDQVHISRAELGKTSIDAQHRIARHFGLTLEVVK